MEFDLNQNDPLYDQKYKEYLSDESNTNFRFWLKPEICSEPMQNMLAYARFIGFKGDHLVLDDLSDKAYVKEAAEAEKEDKYLPEYVDKIFEKPLDIMTEVSAWFVVLWRIEDTLRGYPTTLEQDLEILEENSKS